MASELLLVKDHGRFAPATAADAEIADEMASGVTYRAVLTRPANRSVQHHRLLFALISMAVENYAEPITSDSVLEVLKIRTGHVRVVALITGEIVTFPKSISFVNMDQDAFNKWFPRAVDVLCRDFIPGLANDMAMREIERRAGGSAPALPTPKPRLALAA